MAHRLNEQTASGTMRAGWRAIHPHSGVCLLAKAQAARCCRRTRLPTVVKQLVVALDVPTFDGAYPRLRVGQRASQARAAPSACREARFVLATSKPRARILVTPSLSK